MLNRPSDLIQGCVSRRVTSTWSSSRASVAADTRGAQDRQCLLSLLPCSWCTEGRARHFGRVPRFPSSAIARKRRVSANVGGAGSRPSARAIPTTKTTRRGHIRGVSVILSTGAIIGVHACSKGAQPHAAAAPRRRATRAPSCKDGRVNACFPCAFSTYHLVPAAPSDLAKMDAWTVQITLVSSP